MGNTIVTSQWFVHGRSKYRSSGYQKAAKAYKDPTILETIDMAGKVCMVTGANSGIGKEVAEYLASRGSKVYMVCRNEERGSKAKDEIASRLQAKLPGGSWSPNLLELLIADVGLKADVLRLADEFSAKEGKLDALVCNAGALLNTKQFNAEGVETTLGCHLLHGSYLLTESLIPKLTASTDPRVVLVSSGGMYLGKWPGAAAASFAEPEVEGVHAPYAGNTAYCYSKRAQVLLADEWRKEHGESTGINFVSCHPGWVATPGVEGAFGDKQKWLEPMRNMWEGSEGICWLAATPGESLESGGFYLDREPQVKHIAGPFMTEGSRTKNTTDEVAELMKFLREASRGGSWNQGKWTP